MSAWTDHVAKWKDCTACPLCNQRSNIVLARGHTPCDILFIGEAPGASEDALGEPFVGPAGHKLDEIISRALHGLYINDPAPDGSDSRPIRVTYTNLVACFPREAKERGDNQPSSREILSCAPRLIEFVNIVQPRLIVCVGELAKVYIGHSDTVPCVDIIHPAAILRSKAPVAQKQQLIQRATVIIRSAAEDMVQSELRPFEKWGDKSAYLTTKKRSTKDLDTYKVEDGKFDFDDNEIPF